MMVIAALASVISVAIAWKVRKPRAIRDTRLGRLDEPPAPRNGAYKMFLKGYSGLACTADDQRVHGHQMMHAPGVCGECDWERAAIGCASYRKTGECDATCPHGMCWHANQ